MKELQYTTEELDQIFAERVMVDFQDPKLPKGQPITTPVRVNFTLNFDSKGVESYDKTVDPNWLRAFENDIRQNKTLSLNLEPGEIEEGEGYARILLNQQGLALKLLQAIHEAYPENQYKIFTIRFLNPPERPEAGMAQGYDINERVEFTVDNIFKNKLDEYNLSLFYEKRTQ